MRPSSQPTHMAPAIYASARPDEASNDDGPQAGPDAQESCHANEDEASADEAHEASAKEASEEAHEAQEAHEAHACRPLQSQARAHLQEGRLQVRFVQPR